MKVTFAAVGAVAAGIAAIVLIIAVSYYTGVVGNHVQASYNGRVVTSKVQQNVRTPAFAQAVYEQFFEDCNAVVAFNTQIAQAEQRVLAMKAVPDDQFGQKAGRVADAISDLTGVRQAQVATAARYNAAASEYTRGQFLDSSLPARINEPYTVVSCGQEVTP